MIGRLQGLIDGLRLLGRNVDSYDLIVKILSILPPQYWRAQKIALRASKDPRGAS